MLTATLEVYQNASFKVAVEVSNEDGPITDLSGWTFKAQVRPVSDGALLISFQVSAVGSKVTLGLRPTDTAKLTADAAWDLLGKSPDGTVYRIAQGDVALYAGITELPL